MELPINKILHSDCVKLLKDFPDNSVDLILTDPPYGINFISNKAIKKRFEKIINDDNLDFFEPFVKEAYRIIKNNSCLYIFCRFDNYPLFYDVLKKHGFKVKNLLVWEKSKALGGLGDMEASFLVNYEFIILAMKGRRLLFQGRIGDQFGLIKDTSINNPMKLEYPTQKPISLLRKLISLSSKEGDVVLDCFMGSGSTILAAKQTKRNYIGIDIDKKAVDLANKKLQQEML